MTTPSSKVVIVAGQRFSVPEDTATEAIRQQLLTMGFADVASATVKQGKDPDGTPTIEFVKQAGTKGALAPAALAVVLRGTPVAPLAPRRSYRGLLTQLVAGLLTCADALALPVEDALRAAEIDAETMLLTLKPTEDALCTRLDQLAAIADAAPSAW